MESSFLFEPRQPLGRRLEVKPERPLDRDLPVAEVSGWIYPADDDLLVLTVLLHNTSISVFKSGQNLHDVLSAFKGNLAPFITKTLAHLDPEGRGVDELDFTLALGRLAVRKHPDIGGDAGVVEELLGQRDKRF